MQRSFLSLPMRRWHQASALSCLTLLLCGCATLPSSGPTGGEIFKASDPASGEPGFKIVPLATLADLPPEPALSVSHLPERQAPPTNLIGTGDVLEIAIYEAGVTLFGGASSLPGTSNLPGAQVERLPPFRVDDTGNIHIPYVGLVRATGRTTAELEADIRAGLRGLSENPQILVTIQQAVGNSVILGGEIANPGRLVLPTNRETLLDVIALANGYRGEAKDLAIRVERRDATYELRLSDLLVNEDADFPIYPGDRITLVRQPWTFSVMGAPGRAQQIPFPTRNLSLTEALALAGGSNPNLGDPKAIFIFRFVEGEDGQETPVVYHINMMEPQSFFVSQRFAMHDDDLLYVGNARANQPSKLIQLISQLFAPVMTVRQLSD